MLREKPGSQDTVVHKPATDNLPKCKSSHEVICSKTFNVSITKDKTQGPTHGIFWPLPLLLTIALLPLLPLQSLSPTPDCTAAIQGIHTYTAISHLYNFTPLSLFHQPSSRLPDELFLKFLLMKHQFFEAIPWTSLKHDFLSTLYSIIILVSLYFPCPASLQRYENLKSGDHSIIFLGAIPELGTQ